MKTDPHPRVRPRTRALLLPPWLRTADLPAPERAAAALLDRTEARLHLAEGDALRRVHSVC